MRTVISKKELADRWGCNVTTIDALEREGVICRLSKLPGVKFSVVSIESIEYEGVPQLLTMKDKEIKQLKSEIMKMKKVIDGMREILSSY